MDFTHLLLRLGISSPGLAQFLNILIMFTIAALVGWIAYIAAKKWLAKIVIKIAGRTATQWDDLLFDQKFFNRLGLLIAPIVIQISLASLVWEYMPFVMKALDVWILLGFVMMIGALLDGVNRIYDSYPISRNRPIRVFKQIVMIFIYCAAIIFIIQIFTEKSLTALFAGLTAFAAVLMLIFKDSILGFVAGIQLSANDMVRIGDWIVMPSSSADGDVLEINLTTVKVQNWDKTITTIPTYKMVSESFTNWRGMAESKGRRIKRSINIDINSIHYLSDEELETLKESALLKDYITSKIDELNKFNESRGNILDARRLTNIGTFREYLEAWLSHNPGINLEMTHMVRQLQPTPTGVPLEIYCFSARQKWIEYERVQSDIFDHVFAVMELFNLRPFQFSGTIPVVHD